MNIAPVDVGEVLDGKYRVERVLGVGGMGVVVAAMHLQLDKMVALKFMHEAASMDPEVAARFAREAKAAARLHTRHISKVLDVGNLENGAPYMVMEFLEGSDLRELMKQRKAAGKGPLPVSRAVNYIVQACLGMAEAHAHGFIHRDLKPPNLFLTRGTDGRALIKILDFGIAKASIDGIDTSTQAVMGSPVYMSPEQWEGARYVDERGDIWALGSILHFLLAGKPPFHGDSLPVLFRNIATREPRSLAQPELAIPRGLQTVIRRCLSKSTADRPQTAAALASLLAPFGTNDCLEYAQRAQRIALAGKEGSVLGQGAFPTPVHDLDAKSEVTLPEEQGVSGPTSVTTLSNAGTLPGVTTQPEYSASRNWLPYGGAAAILIAAIAFGAIAAERESADQQAATTNRTAAAPDDEVASDDERPVQPKLEGDGVTPELPTAEVPDTKDDVVKPDLPLAVMTDLTLSTSPEGARIWINGEERGVSPLQISLAVGSTAWARFDLEGYDSLEREIEVDDDVTKQSFYLVSISGVRDSGEENSASGGQKDRQSRTRRARDNGRVIKSGKTRDEDIRGSADRRH
jgi:serine/threonine-protein kinase